MIGEWMACSRPLLPTGGASFEALPSRLEPQLSEPGSPVLWQCCRSAEVGKNRALSGVAEPKKQEETHLATPARGVKTGKTVPRHRWQNVVCRKNSAERGFFESRFEERECLFEPQDWNLEERIAFFGGLGAAGQERKCLFWRRWNLTEEKRGLFEPHRVPGADGSCLTRVRSPTSRDEPP